MGMNMTHTPGPWLFRGKSSSVHAPPQNGPGQNYQYGDQLFRFRDDDDDAASISDENLALVLAAPDLLQGLEDMIGHCQGCNGRGRFYGPVPGSPGSYASNQPCQDCNDARAAIKKARGEP
jgi:hypothetical protein